MHEICECARERKQNKQNKKREKQKNSRKEKENKERERQKKSTRVRENDRMKMSAKMKRTKMSVFDSTARNISCKPSVLQRTKTIQCITIKKIKEYNHSNEASIIR